MRARQHYDGLSAAELVKLLREQEGSHDKLAARLGTSRQRVIKWEQGGGIGERYAVKLSEASGLPKERFRPPPAERASRRKSLEEQVAEQAETIRQLADRLTMAEARIAKLAPRRAQRPPAQEGRAEA